MKKSVLIFYIIILIPTACLTQNLFFDDETIDDQVQIGYGLAIGDVDGDAKSDILLADKKAFIWYRNPDWKRFTLIENLTERDNVCIAARDINGDGLVEIAVGAQWNPGETSDERASGSVHYLMRPSEVSQPWTAHALPHEPTVHRMRWVRTRDGYQLVVLPLHGRGNKQARGQGVKIYAYKVPDDPRHQWTRILVDSSMHLTHNFDVIEARSSEALIIGGKEGSKYFGYHDGAWHQIQNPTLTITKRDGFGEIRKSRNFLVGIQPFHGNILAVYPQEGSDQVLTMGLAEGHALACADVLNQGMDQIIVGWRKPNNDEQIGIKIFVASKNDWSVWKEYWVDQGEMACEDLKIADLNEDGKKDIIAAGRSTGNLKIYWNKN